MAVPGGSIGTGRAGGLASAAAAPSLSSAINPAGCQSGCEDEGTHRPPPSFSSFVHVFSAIQIEDEDEHENEE